MTKIGLSRVPILLIRLLLFCQKLLGCTVSKCVLSIAMISLHWFLPFDILGGPVQNKSNVFSIREKAKYLGTKALMFSHNLISG